MKQPIIFISQQHNAPPPQNNRKPEIVILMLMFTCMVKKKKNLRSVTILSLCIKILLQKLLSQRQYNCFAYIGQIRDEDKELDRIHRERRTRLQEVCSNRNLAYLGKSREEQVREHFIFDEKSQVLYCTIEKVGSTFWRRLFQVSL